MRKCRALVIVIWTKKKSEQNSHSMLKKQAINPSNGRVHARLKKTCAMPAHSVYALELRTSIVLQHYSDKLTPNS